MRLLLYSLCFSIIISSCNQQTESRMATTKADSIFNEYTCCTPEVLDTTWYSSGKKTPLFSGLDGIHFSVSTKNVQAQKYFDQGMMLSFAFNHAEAGRSFFEATRQDSTCAMCWWGFAYIL